MKKSIVLSVVTSGVLVAGAYKLPEQSLNSMALGAACVAHTTQADAAYFNPANMAFMGEKQYADGALTLIHLPSNTYEALDNPLYSGESETENIVAPTMHYVSAPMGDFRWGVSMVVPGGLTKRWETPYQKLYAEEFTLKNVEINPVVSYRVNEQFAIGGGLRIVYSEGVVKSDGRGDTDSPVARHMEGDTLEFGYNLALSYRPTSDIEMALTYRSNIDLDEEGDANLWMGNSGEQYGASVSVPLPAALNVAVAKTWNETLTLEFNYERTFWSEYEKLDFNYDREITNPYLNFAFNRPIDKYWEDTDTFRLGATWVVDRWTWMAGIAIDETPVPKQNIGFELPDSDATVYSAGFRYQQSEALSWGVAVLIDDKESRTIPKGLIDAEDNKVLAEGGTFDDGGAYLVTVGMAYAF